jgi:hypothetical protein
LANTVKNSDAGKTILMKGDCTEDRSVIVTENDIIIDGQGGTITGNGVDPVFTITGTNVTIKNFKNIKGGKHGVVVQGDGFSLTNTSISNNKEVGLLFGSEDKAMEILEALSNSKPIDSIIRQQKITKPLVENISSFDLSHERKMSWLNQIINSSFNPIKMAYAQEVAVPTVGYNAALCDTNIFNNKYGLIIGLDLFTNIVAGNIKSHNSAGRCQLTIKEHEITGLGVFSGTFSVQNTTLKILNNNIMGVFAVNSAALLIDSGSVSTLSVSGHRVKLCNLFPINSLNGTVIENYDGVEGVVGAFASALGIPYDSENRLPTCRLS